MCLAVPARVVKIEGNSALVQWGTENEPDRLVKREVCLELVEGVREGDYILVHSGFAIHVLDEEQAQAGLSAWRELLK